MEHVTMVNGKVRTIVKVTRTKQWGEQMTTLDDGTTIMSEHAWYAGGSLRLSPVEHTAQGEINIIDEFPLR